LGLNTRTRQSKTKPEYRDFGEVTHWKMTISVNELWLFFKPRTVENHIVGQWIFVAGRVSKWSRESLTAMWGFFAIFVLHTYNAHYQGQYQERHTGFYRRIPCGIEWFGS
jgi:hypothetical protein